ncbi:MAG: sodium:solute symporter family protein [Candidatus Woesearchaeota archaeon]
MIDKAIIIAYLTIMLAIGIYFAKKNKNEEGFFLASRNLGSFPIAASIFSTLGCAGSLFMTTALSYTYGISVIWFFISAFIGFMVFALAVPKIKAIADKHNCITLPEILKIKLDKKCMIISSLITIAIYGGFVAVNFLAAGIILNMVFNISIVSGAIIFALIVTLYSMLGGFKGIVWTDIVQMFIILTGTMILLTISIRNAGGFSSLVQLPDLHKSITGMGWPLIVGMFISTILAYFASQDIFQRVFAAKSNKIAKKSIIIMGFLILLIGAIVILLGMFGKLLFPEMAAGEIIPALTTAFIPIGLAGIVLASYLAMANSTSDSELLTVTSNIIRDFMQNKNKKIPPIKQVAISRIVLIGVAAIALVFALTIQNITDIVLSMYTWLGILGMNVIAALFWKKANSNAIFWSLVSGFGTAIAYTTVTGDFETAMIIGLLPTFIVLITVSLLTKKKVN